jgi:hypothetical protein
MNLSMEEKINEYFYSIKKNHDDYVWLLFEKPCGYSFCLPFLKNLPTSSIYSHLDNIWTQNLVCVYTEKDEILYRGNSLSIRDWIRNTGPKCIKSDLNQPLVYKIYFDTLSYDIKHSNNCCKKIVL